MIRVVIAVAILLAAYERADACACCDSSTTRTPIGWTEAGGALVIAMSTNAACEFREAYEIWPINASQPSACYDRYGADPDKRTTCDFEGLEAKTDGSVLRTTTKIQRFSRKPITLPSRVVVIRDKTEPDVKARVVVEIDVGGTWKRAWTGTVRSPTTITDAAGRTYKITVAATIYPNVRGDRAAMLMTGEDSAPGMGHWATTVRWIDVPK